MKHYVIPKNDKIRNYNKIIAQGNVVVRIKKFTSDNVPKTILYRIWENQYGGGIGQTYYIPNEYKAGDFIIPKEEYQKLIKTSL